MVKAAAEAAWPLGNEVVHGWRVSRREGAVFLLLYVIYLAVLLTPGLRQGLGLA